MLIYLKTKLKNIFQILLTISAVLLFLSNSSFRTSAFIDVGNPNIEYIGRFDFSRPGIVRFDWPGVQIRTNFSGTFCAIRLKDGRNDYNILIDDKLHKVLRTKSDTVYTIAENLNEGKHSLLISKRTEAVNGIASFEGFIINHGDSLFSLAAKRKRKIEFIGDSFVAGLGSEGKTPDCLFSRETDNNYIAFGPVLARRLNADYSVIAISGIGVLRNNGDTSLTSQKPLPYYYDRACFNETLKWDFKKWQPDLVVIRLGNNDYWHKPYPVISKFENAYLSFLRKIRDSYPNSIILVLSEPVRKDPHSDYVNSVVTEMKNKFNDRKIFYKEINANLDISKDFGCQDHPNESGHKKIADALEPIVRKALNW